MKSEELKGKVIELMDKQKRLELATMAAAVESIRDGLKWESDFIRGRGQEEADDVGHIILGDVKINEEKQTTGQTPGWAKVLATAVVTSLLGGGAGAAAVKLLSKPAAVQKIQDTLEYEMDFAQPKTKVKEGNGSSARNPSQ